MVGRAAQVPRQRHGDRTRFAGAVPAERVGREHVGQHAAQLAPQPGAGRDTEPVLAAAGLARRQDGAGRTPEERLRAPQSGAGVDREPESVLRESAVEKGGAYLESGRQRRAVSLYEVVLGEVEDQVERAGDLPGGAGSEGREGIVRLAVRLRVQDLALDLRDEQAAERLGREAPPPAQVSLERGPAHLAQEAAEREA